MATIFYIRPFWDFLGLVPARAAMRKWDGKHTAITVDLTHRDGMAKVTSGMTHQYKAGCAQYVRYIDGRWHRVRFPRRFRLAQTTT